MNKFVFYVLMLMSNVVIAQTTSTSGMIDSATGNLIYSTVNPAPTGVPASWSGIVSTQSNGGGYSGGYTPGYNPNTGTFMFGYTQSTIAYTTPISAVNFALANAGTGIQINGFRYSWQYLNQDYSRGNLSANVNLTSSTGQVVQNYNYPMPHTTTGWTTMSGIENFNTQYAPSSLGNLNVKFSGKDDRYWAGYYGPQVRAIDVGLLYSVQAPPPIPTDFAYWNKLTDENGSFTLTKAGVVRYGAQGTYIYQSLQPGTYSCSNSAWGRDPLGGVYKECDLGTNTAPTTSTPITLPKTTTTTATDTTSTTLLDPVTTTTSPTTTTSTAVVTEPVATVVSNPTTTAPTSQPTQVASVVSAPSPASATTSSTTSSSSSSSSTMQTTKEASSSGGSNVGLALSIISKNSDRDAAVSAIAQSAVAQAQAQANQAQQDASTVASNAVSNSTTMNAVSVGGQQSNGNGIRANTNASSVQSSSSNNTSSTTVTTTFGSFSGSNIVSSQQSLEAVVINSATQATYNSSTTNLNTSSSIQTSELYALVPPNFLTDKSNPINDIVDGKQSMPQSSTNPLTGPVVNKNVGDNDIAGGISINKMALAPAGYGDYLNFALKDAAFYAPKEVYRNQRNVDNARALRQMTSDSKHKEMVEMQYAK
jgi:hypothetical protein